jgi:hypothetical protein
MKKFTFRVIYASLAAAFVLTGSLKTNPVWAQENDSEEFFNQGTQEMNEEVQNLEERQEQTLEQKEEKLEQELEIHQEVPRIETVPAPEDALGIDADDNFPFQPNDEEVEVTF